MALRLEKYVVCGALFNTSHYSTHGYIVLRGDTPKEDTALYITLTGDCCDDLKGKHFRFIRANDDSEPAVFREEEHPGIQMRQIGPTGTMTARGWVRTMPCAVKEFTRRAALGEPPPTSWKRRLYLEWFSQNGRVVVEMAGPVVEQCVREPRNKEDEGDWETLPNEEPPPESGVVEIPAGLGITQISLDGDEVHTEVYTPCEEPEFPEEDTACPTDLQRQLDAEAAAIDRAISGEETGGDDAIRELELIDDCLEHGETTPLESLLGDTHKLLPAEALDDDSVEAALKTLLARLAMLGIVLDVCAHFTPRDCYRILRDEILPESGTYPELGGTSWVQHFSTYEHCAECDAEFEAEYLDRGPFAP